MQGYIGTYGNNMRMYGAYMVTIYDKPWNPNPKIEEKKKKKKKKKKL